MRDFARTWLPLGYLYGVGGFAFLVGIYLILKTNALDVSLSEHKKWLVILIFGFIYYASIHATFILVAQ